MCNPALRQALIAAHRLRELARLRRVRDRIGREYARPLDVEALARDADMPPGQLGRRFRDAYGQSAYAYLTACRVEQAMALLRHGDHSPADLCRAVGCPSTAVLVARFTELAGMPPGDYRRLAAAGTPGLPWRVAAPVPPSSSNGEAAAGAPHLALLP